MKKVMALALVLFCLLFSAGCFSNIDMQKFREIRTAAREIDKAVGDTTLSYARFGELLEKLGDGIAKAKTTVSTAQEKSLLSSFEVLLSIYKDSYTLWGYKVASSQYEWIPSGRIYMDATVRTIAEKYHMPAESHVIELTDHHWESVSAESIRVIWEKAHDQLKKCRL